MGAIYKREIKAYFMSPTAYIFLAVFYVISGFYFVNVNIFGMTTDMSYVFSGVFTIMMILLPLLTMRLFSEEKKQKTDQCLLTAPVGLMGIVMGKFLAALTVFAVAMAVYIPYILVLVKLGGGIAWASVIGNMVGLLLLGAAFISIGIFISSLTELQIVAAILSMNLLRAFSISQALYSLSAQYLCLIFLLSGCWKREDGADTVSITAYLK